MGHRRGNSKAVRRERGKPRPCPYCKAGINYVDYKDHNALRRFVSDRGKIRARRITGLCPQHQRDAAIAVKRAREMALLPYVARR